MLVFFSPPLPLPSPPSPFSPPPPLDSDDIVINGSKMWITNGAQADWICLLATTSDGASHRNKSLICVPMDTTGITVARKIDKLGKYLLTKGLT